MRAMALLRGMRAAGRDGWAVCWGAATGRPSAPPNRPAWSRSGRFIPYHPALSEIVLASRDMYKMPAIVYSPRQAVALAALVPVLYGHLRRSAISN